MLDQQLWKIFGVEAPFGHDGVDHVRHQDGDGHVEEVFLTSGGYLSTTSNHSNADTHTDILKFKKKIIIKCLK